MKPAVIALVVLSFLMSALALGYGGYSARQRRDGISIARENRAKLAELEKNTGECQRLVEMLKRERGEP